MNVLAVDPGGTTGMALLLDGEFSSTEKVGYEDAARAIANVAADYPLAAIVCEGFVIRPNTHKLDAGAFAQTTDLIGACRFVALTNGIPFVRQTPGQAKGFASNEHLHRLGWYTPSPGGHRNDAARHLLTYLASVKHLPTLRRLTDDL